MFSLFQIFFVGTIYLRAGVHYC